MRTVHTFVPSPLHAFPEHPERPGRLDLLAERLSGLSAERISHAAASPEEITSVHSAQLLTDIRAACAQAPVIIDYAPTYVSKSTYEDALSAAGAALACTRAVLRGEADNALAVVRPPGHHAEPGRAMGFCIFNNIAVAARAALASGVQRVMVVDYDAHHGNGTQAAFLDEERVAFVSLHQWGIYPGSGWIEDAPRAKQRIINVPLAEGAGEGTYLRVLDEVVRPAVEAFRPEVMLVSAGFDGHWSDPITSLGLSTSAFFSISQGLVTLAQQQCGGRIVFVLEGGYDPANVANGAMAVFAALAGSASGPQTADACPQADPDHGQRIEQVRRWHGFA